VPTPNAKLIVTGLLLGLLAALPAPARAAIVESELQQALDDLVATPGGPPGAIAIVQVGNRTQVFTAGIGDLNSRRRMRPSDHMRIASVSKAFSSAVALSLVERGVLSLDDTVGELVPGFNPDWDGATLRELLNHTSGIPSFTKSQSFFDRLIAYPRKPVAAGSSAGSNGCGRTTSPRNSSESSPGGVDSFRTTTMAFAIVPPVAHVAGQGGSTAGGGNDGGPPVGGFAGS
jgi:CubicO group peptidase (beta-lactamase class C family)